MPRSAVEHVDLSRGFNKLDRARLKLLAGDETGADEDVRAVAEAFADRLAISLEGLRAEVRGK